ncbi:dihydropteroate synthase [Larkinella arboricola]|uniref:dihydropteroate synthase n=1 Tax=Larkinella arboricola TaxID=643671 RepID=A0A327WMH6_LARAB|nr:dihydropteroate synthase [Larkinella arboricola]RAJ92621.1 dihydropteroate synthase [Larkinella arboricola]
MPKVTKKTLNLRGNVLDLTTPVVMGILNSTTDSFFAGSRLPSVDQAVERAAAMQSEGALLIDIGGYSTRPGAADISPQEEADRVLPVIEALTRAIPAVWISVDTFRASVARQAVEAGAVLVNDVSGGTLDARMFETVARLRVPYVLMHMRGTPQTMAQHSHYRDLVPDVLGELQEQLTQLRALGQADVLIDPGFGFAKTPRQNFQLLNQLEAFQTFDAPLLVGLSRKSTIWRTLNVQPEEALNGTTVLNTLALAKGADILRVHDVREAVEAIKLVTSCQQAA